MKKIFIIVAFASASVLSACNNKAKEQQAAVEKQKTVAAVKDSMRLDSFKRAEASEVQAQRDREVAAAAKQSVQSTRSSGGGTANTNYGGTTTAPAAKKEGWSAAAKDATIGGLAGAVGGALIDKKKGRGAIIGGVLGAGAGYVIGRDKDKKTGRVQPKN